MSFFSIPKGLFRTANAFSPSSLIDTLYDYGSFLSSADAQGAVAAGPSAPKQVAIIGGGAAGLVCAYELSRINNINVTLYEASGAIGGRMDSIYWPDGTLNQKVFEMGCMRFPTSSATLFHYLGKFGLPATRNFPDPGKVYTQLYYNNTIIEWPAGQPTPSNADFQRIGNDFTNIITSLLGDVNNPNTSNPSKLFDYWAIYESSPSAANKNNVIQAWQAIINDWKDISYYDGVYTLAQNTSIVTQPWTLEDMNKFGALGVGSGGFGPLFQVGFLEIIRLFANGLETDQELLQGGIGSLVDSFGATITTQGGSIIPNTAVTAVAQSNGQYQLTLSTGATVSYDSVVCATTTRAMEFMGLTSGQSVLPQPQRVAIRNLHLMDSSKFFVLTTSKFWYKENNPTGADLPANIQTDESLRGLYCLDYDSQYGQPPITGGKGVVLVSYVWGDDSSKLLSLTPDQRYAQFLATLNEVDPTFAQMLSAQTEQVSMIDWENAANFYGAFKINYPGQEPANQDAFFQFQQANQGFFMAGDSVSFAGGWLEGAMPTGVNAACAVAQYLGGTVLDASPLTIPAAMYDYSAAPATATKKKIKVSPGKKIAAAAMDK
jgi:tryptophan 2-monooxygenase